MAVRHQDRAARLRRPCRPENLRPDLIGMTMSTTRERLYLFDTTLRDGRRRRASTSRWRTRRGSRPCSTSFGIDYVEGGYPGANPQDTGSSRPKATQSAKFTAFGMTKRAGRSAANDPGIAALSGRRLRRDLLRGEGVGLPCPRGAGLHARGKPRGHHRQHRGGAGARPRSAARLRTFLRRLQGQP